MASEEQTASVDAAELARTASRAGLHLSESEAASLVEPYRRTQAALGRLRAVLDAAEEPSNVFHAAVVEGQ
jgi:hypothetical protein